MVRWFRAPVIQWQTPASLVCSTKVLDITTEGPSYLRVLANGELAHRAKLAESMLACCRLCGWDCGIDRSSEVGPCRTGTVAVVATAYLHFGEEAPLIGKSGSGAIFFANCDLRCQFCQTYRWNIKGQGRPVTARQLADSMLSLQEKGAVNINLVTPTHVLPQILGALFLAATEGLSLPLVWNSGGYDTLEALKLLDGIVDIYLPDMKYSEPGLALRLSGIRNYPAVNQRAVAEMYRQVGDLLVNSDGVAARGLLVRHLVMPGHLDNTRGVLSWIRDNLGENTYLSLMDQYRPAYRAFARADIGRPISPDEYQQARKIAEELGLKRLDQSLVLASS